MTNTSEPSHYRMVADSGHINISMYSFDRCAHDYFRCVELLESEKKFSQIFYPLLCRAIEMKLKSLHLEQRTPDDLRAQFGHKISDLYHALPVGLKILTESETKALGEAQAVYDVGKALDYVQPLDMAHGYNRFPKVSMLKDIASKLLQISRQEP